MRPAPVRGRRRFSALVTRGRRARCGPVTVSFLRSEDEAATVGVAYAVGRRVGGAVLRNRWRRRLRAIAGEVVDALPGGVYLISLGPAVNNLGFAEVKDQVMNAIEQVTRPQ